ncbi:MAG: methylenetetrahydrofolate reductase [NAD(P)H] [Treponemataceae bacterium]|nr:methylenetetrahydrofolate reductase [NAD(P)H] [Treponemataceae bacterium]
MKPVFSFEVFPPKKTMNIETVYTTLDELKDLTPDFISVTYGAGGSDNCSNTVEIARHIKEVCGVESVAHLPCINLTKTQAENVLQQFKAAGIRNILALRGDRSPDVEPAGDFTRADQLVSFIKDWDKDNTFSIYAACYPELHPESTDVFQDLRALKAKHEAGADHFISQLFFDNDCFYRMIERARLTGVTAPIEAGIMPATNRKSIERMVSLTNAQLPKKFTKMMAKYENSPEAIRDAGIAYAIDQIVDLVTNGVDGIHLYTMNNPYVARRINEAVRSLFI